MLSEQLFWFCRTHLQFLERFRFAHLFIAIHLSVRLMPSMEELGFRGLLNYRLDGFSLKAINLSLSYGFQTFYFFEICQRIFCFEVLFRRNSIFGASFNQRSLATKWALWFLSQIFAIFVINRLLEGRSDIFERGVMHWTWSAF